MLLVFYYTDGGDRWRLFAKTMTGEWEVEKERLISDQYFFMRGEFDRIKGTNPVVPLRNFCEACSKIFQESDGKGIPPHFLDVMDLFKPDMEKVMMADVDDDWMDVGPEMLITIAIELLPKLISCKHTRRDIVYKIIQAFLDLGDKHLDCFPRCEDVTVLKMFKEKDPDWDPNGVDDDAFPGFVSTSWAPY